METLSHILNRLFNKQGYNYYKKMIDDYINGDWNYDIKQLVEYQNVKQKVSVTFSRKGYKILRVRVVKDIARFEEEMLKYYNMHILPLKIIREDLILARKIFMEKHGFITEGNLMCKKANYVCENCLNYINGCKIAMKYTCNQPNVKRMTKMLEVLYTNLGSPLCQLQIKEGLKYL